MLNYNVGDTEMPKVIVFDVDGTLADIEHRRHWVENKPKNWNAFFAVQHEDPPHEEIVWLARQLNTPNTTVLICSGRSCEFRKVTEEWLSRHNVEFEELFMRHINDRRPDSEVKVELLAEIREKYGEPYLWIDDRKTVTEAIRNEGVRVLQVCEGDY